MSAIWPAGWNSSILLPPAVVRRFHHLNHPTDVGDCHALVDQLLAGSLLRSSLRLKLADDPIFCVTGTFQFEVLSPVWPAVGH